MTGFTVLLLYLAWSWNMNINENVKQPIDYKTATLYSTILVC